MGGYSGDFDCLLLLLAMWCCKCKVCALCTVCATWTSSLTAPYPSYVSSGGGAEARGKRCPRKKEPAPESHAQQQIRRQASQEAESRAPRIEPDAVGRIVTDNNLISRASRCGASSLIDSGLRIKGDSASFKRASRGSFLPKFHLCTNTFPKVPHCLPLYLRNHPCRRKEPRNDHIWKKPEEGSR